KGQLSEVWSSQQLQAFVTTLDRRCGRSRVHANKGVPCLSTSRYLCPFALSILVVLSISNPRKELVNDNQKEFPMPLDPNRPGFIRKTLRYRKYPKISRNKPATLLIAVVALVAVAAFSVSVSRSAGWLWKSQPGTPSTSSSSKPEPVKTATSAPASVASHRSIAPNVAPFVPTISATKTDSLVVDADNDGKADPGDTLKYTVNLGATGEDALGVQFNDTVDP